MDGYLWASERERYEHREIHGYICRYRKCSLTVTLFFILTLLKMGLVKAYFTIDTRVFKKKSSDEGLQPVDMKSVIANKKPRRLILCAWIFGLDCTPNIAKNF